MKSAKHLILLIVGLFVYGCALVDGRFPQQRGVEGVWYTGGSRDRVSRIASGRDGLEARNERGEVSRLRWDGSRTLVALDWEGGLRGEFTDDRIQWANGAFWSRDRSSQAPRVEGVWYTGGSRDRVSRIVSGRDGLEARNERGEVSRLRWDGSRTLVALDWGDLRGEYSNDRIQWANGNFWSRNERR